MTKRKERSLDVLYGLTEKLIQPEITPVLKGSFPIQGPVDAADNDLQRDKEDFPADLRNCNGSVNKNVRMRAEPGTCNVCATPCSSCMHACYSLSFMESKIEGECSNDTCGIKETRLLKSRACDDRQTTASETSNLLSSSSCHDSISENAESNISVKASHIFEDVEMVPKLQSPGGGTIGEYQGCRSHIVAVLGEDNVSSPKPTPSFSEERIFSKKIEQRGLECHGDNISCVTGVKDANTASKKNGSGIASTFQCLPPKTGPAEYPSSKDMLGIGDSKKLTENLSPPLQGEPSESSIDHVESSLAGPVTIISTDEKKFVLPDFDQCKPSLVGSDLSAPMKTEFDMDNENLPSKSAKFSEKSKQARETSAMFEASNMQINSLQSHLAAESEQSGSDIVEDVKVCDICGDAGREDMLAICSRCSDGAEHTYCMQIMLDKVPEGDWLCEGCKEKEDAENKNHEKPEKTDSATSSKVPSLSEKSQNKGPINPNILPILDTTEQGTEGNHSIKVPPSPQVTKRQSNDLEASSVPKKQPIDTNARSPGRTPLHRVNSLNVLKSTQSQHCNNNKNSEASQALTTSSSNSSSIQTRLLSPRRPFSRSNTFSSLNSKPKVKQVLEDVSQKQKVARESGTRKEGLGRTMGKSMSFKPTTSSHSTANEPKMKMQSHNLSLAEDPKGMNFTKEKQLLERKCSFKSDHPGISSSPTIPTSVSFRKTDATVTVANKGSVAATASDKGGEMKKQSSLSGVVKKQSSLSVEVKKQLSSAVCNFDEQKQFLSVPKEELKAKDSSSLSGPQQTASAVGRNVRCQKCNDAGHTAQFCTSDSLRVSALKASAMRSSMEGIHKSNKWKDAVEAAMSRTTVHTTNNRVSDQAAELSMSNISLSSEAARSKDKFSSSSSCLRNLPHFEPAFPAREVDPVPSISDSSMKPSMTKMPPQVSLVGHPMRFSAIPEHDYLWQGGFDVQRTGGKFLEFFNGVQAHLSTCASPKVPEVVNKFPRKLLLEEVPRLSSWPLQFQGKGANEDNIALYFFAKDLESYEKYKKLVENMIKNDLALKGNFDRVELLIFSSNQLPEKAHRWNRLFYLWAVFRERRENCSESHPDSLKKLCGDSLAVVTNVKGLPNTVISDVNVSVEIRPEGYVTKELPTGNSSPKQMGAIKSSISADLPSLPSSPKGKTQNCHKKSQSLDQKFVGPFNEHMQLPVGDSLLSQYTSSMFPEIRPSTSVSKLGCALDTASEVNGNVALNEVYRDLKRGNGFDIRAVQATSGHSELSKGTAVSTYSDTANCEQAGFTSSLLARHDISSSSSKKIPGSSSHVQETGAEGNSRHGEKTVDKEKEMLIRNGIWAERDMWRDPIKTESSGESSKKRPRYSPDNVSETSVEASRSSLVMAWKENNSTVDGETKQKKIKCYTESSFRSEDGGLFSGILNHNSSLSKVGGKGDPTFEDPVFPGNLRTAERSFFPVNLGPVEECRLSNSVPWHVVSVDDEDLPGSDLPSLELALGAEKKSSKKVLPSFLRLIDEKSSQITVPDQVTDGGDDEASASLSLSLAFPITKTEQTTKPVPKTEQLLPERRHVNTSLLLFGSLTDN